MASNCAHRGRACPDSHLYSVTDYTPINLAILATDNPSHARCAARRVALNLSALRSPSSQFGEVFVGDATASE
jgi:hypothetical protein